MEESSTVYEIEALYGRGLGLGRNLYEKIEKAKNHGIRHVHLVFSPLHYFILGKTIERYLKEVRKAMEGIEIYIDIPMLHKGIFKTIRIKPEKQKENS